MPLGFAGLIADTTSGIRLGSACGCAPGNLPAIHSARAAEGGYLLLLPCWYEEPAPFGLSLFGFLTCFFGLSWLLPMARSIVDSARC